MRLTLLAAARARIAETGVDADLGGEVSRALDSQRRTSTAPDVAPVLIDVHHG